eukprot:m.178928 g.178928  ORF g.178928 m.178928 type:complete len:386 (-) comp25374_c0_seq17:218-1375(-)
MGVQDINTKADYEKAIDNKQLVVIDFYAKWCSPCKIMAPEFEEIAEDEDYKGVLFYKLDIEENEEASIEADVETLPTFHLYKSKKKLAEMIGIDPDDIDGTVEKLQGLIEKHKREPTIPYHPKAKRTKTQAMLENSKVFSAHPTPFLLLAGIGVENGVSEAEIQAAAQPYPIVEVHFILNEYRVLLGFENKTIAAKALAQLDGHIFSKSKKPAAAVFCAPLPSMKQIPCNALDVVPGLFFVPDFISQDEEQEILSYLNDRPWEDLHKRRVQHYGHVFDYATNSANSPAAEPMPPFCEMIFKRFKERFPEHWLPFDQVTINEYTNSQGIPPHVDTHGVFGPCIIALRPPHSKQPLANPSNARSSCHDWKCSLCLAAFYSCPSHRCN